MKTFAPAAVILFVFGGTAVAKTPFPPPVVMISIDGLPAEDLNHARERGLHVDHLLALAAHGVRAQAVKNVAPTITYPNHTTIITGVLPTQHMVLGNVRFDPEGKLSTANYWFADDIKVPTLWDAVHAAGGRVANIYWPVAVGSRSIDINFPEYWAGGQPKNLSLIAALSSTQMLPGADEPARRDVLKLLIEPTTAGDQARIDLALDIFAKEKPRLTTLHLVSLDETEHREGPQSVAKADALDALDRMIGAFVDRVRAIEPSTRFIVVSDHGQEPSHNRVNLGVLLAKAGFETPAAATGVEASWRAAIWNVGSAYLLVKDPAVGAAALKTLQDYAAQPDSPIEKIVPMAQSIADRPDAQIAAIILFHPGFDSGAALTGDIVTPSQGRGQHGNSPDHPELRSVFIAAGPGIPTGQSLGVVDMRAIAPTVAKLLGVPMPSAPAHPLF